MKIQELAIIFILIILPISLVLSAYTQFQINTVNMQTQYDNQLTAATYDAIKAYQINAENSTTSDLSNSKIRDIEASVSTFKNSIMSAFRLNGYTEEEMNNYIPALVYTMYDGFYIYSPYQNTEDGNNAEYGLKPYISYSCRYKKGNNIDIVIKYSLDNYITIQGMIDGEYVNESGYLIDGIEITSLGEVKYNGIKIEKEELKEYLPVPNPETNTIPETYSYVKINGTKYYDRGDAIIYLLNGTVSVQCSKTDNYPNDEYGMYQTLIKNNSQAIQYYTEAKEFTDKVRNTLRLEELTYENAYDVDGNTQLWPDNTTKIFSDNKNNIENELSNFNQHRLEIIRHVIENNLSIAIANYNNYSKSTTNDFQMPKLKEDEWEYITHNISMISFLQGLSIGGKVYNGYTIVTNSESKEVVLENNIYILGNDGDYHKIGDKTLEVGTSVYGDKISAGRLNLDFKRKIITNNSKSVYYYPLKDYDASYTSVVMQDNMDTYDDIYAYINSKDDDLKKSFYTALGREREGKYNQNNININNETRTPTYIPDGYTHVSDTTMDTGYVIEDKYGNQYVWIEVPKTLNVYQTSGLNISEFTEEEYIKIENDLHTYTNTYRNGTTYTDTWSSKDATGLTQKEYNVLKKKMLKSIYLNGGFYIGRYETGIDYSETQRTSAGATTQSPVIKANAYTYNYVTSAQSQELSEKFATNGYKTSLMFGVQWDLMLKHLEIKGTTREEIMENSTKWGNYVNSTYEITNTSAKYSIDQGKTYNSGSYTKTSGVVLLTTGASSKFSRSEIYDVAGNVWEWTLENTLNANMPCASRGADFDNNGDNRQAGYRDVGSTSYSYNDQGFRVALYTDEDVIYTENDTPEVDDGNDVPETSKKYIPIGFTEVADSEEERIIQDSKGNQYVWVEVPKTLEVYITAGLEISEFTNEEYTKIETDLKSYTIAYNNSSFSDTWSSANATGLTETEYYTLKKKMLKSVYQNGGFYVGRYETGTVTLRSSKSATLTTPVIQQNMYPYNYVTNKQAQSLASGMESGEYTTSLMFGIQWDLTLKYMETKGASQTELKNDSTGWGNFGNSVCDITNALAKYSTNSGKTWLAVPYSKKSGTRVLLTTGSSNQFSKSEIYDLAGNVWEWTLENKPSSSDRPCVYRGGNFAVNGNSLSASYRSSYQTTNSLNSVGFRVSLY